MYFSRITFNTGTMNPDELVSLIKRDLYAIHNVLWELFPGDPHAKRDFLFRKETNNGWPFFYMVSNRQPKAPNGSVKVDTKLYHPKLYAGQQETSRYKINKQIVV